MNAEPNLTPATPKGHTVMSVTTLAAADVAYEHGDGNVTALLPRKYPHTAQGVAQLDDDGIVDPVAVDRAAHGDTTVRLTPREVVCVVAQLAARGRADEQIAEALGRDGKRGRDYVLKIRQRHGILAGLGDGENTDKGSRCQRWAA